MIIETKLKAGLTVSILLTIWMSVMWGNAGNKVIDQQKTIDSLTNLSDSLYDESFQNSIETMRYEAALEIYKEKNPKAVEEIELIKTTQTE
jgi:predicted nucleotide-binding protein (sugar kinase/HSP70/actin superfamily)